MAVALPVSSSESIAAQAARLRAVDLLLLAYLAVVSVVAALRVSSRPGCWWLLLAHALFVVLLFLVTRPGLGPVGRTLRELYPLFLLPALYSELDILNSGPIPVYDRLVQHWELLLFGGQISREWWQAAPSRVWSTVLHAAYLSYYLIVSAPALFLAWRGDVGAVRRFVLVVMTTFVICYLVFIFFPVAGPYYEFPRPPAWFTDNLPARLAYDALATGSSYGAAFPSSHVAAALAATLAASRVSRRLGLLLLVPTLLLTIGVVYCQMHYGVDALAGLVVGALVTLLVGGSVSGERGEKNASGQREVQEV
ncbi:MAG TPA: phosphatase PAP2 family protein [Gemmatimonadales bacterium]